MVFQKRFDEKETVNTALNVMSKGNVHLLLATSVYKLLKKATVESLGGCRFAELL